MVVLSDLEHLRSDGISLTDAARRGRGKYPAELLAENPDLRDECAESTYRPPTFEPELHPLDSEWYFTERTSAHLARRLDSRGTVLLLGNPTVAAQMRTSDYQLVDNSPYIGRRFPDLDPAHHERLRVQSLRPHSIFDAALLDPPWYFPEMLEWLSVASNAVRVGGLIMVPLIGEGTRPSAADDRNRLLEWLATVGEPRVERDLLEYDIPLYEYRALRAAGICLSAPWRCADLATVEVTSQADGGVQPIPSQPLHTDAWRTFLVGSQVVKVRAPSGPHQEHLLAPAPGFANYDLDTVSRRDRRLDAISIWTSRNRVASIGDYAGVVDLMRMLEGPSHGLAQRVKTLSKVNSTYELLALLELN